MSDHAGESEGNGTAETDGATDDGDGMEFGTAVDPDERSENGHGEGAAGDEPTDGEPEGAEGTAADGATEVSEALADRVADLDQELGEAVADLEARVGDLEAELADREEEISELKERLKRKQADFQNYKKRAKKRQEQLKERATEDLVERLVPVRDNLLRALDQDADADIRPGVRSTLEEFDRVLSEENVVPIEPDEGTEIDPQRHEVMMRVESETPEGTVAELYRPGYEMGGKVIQAAQVTVSEGPPADADGDTAGGAAAGGDGSDGDGSDGDGSDGGGDADAADGDGTEPGVGDPAGAEGDR